MPVRQTEGKEVLLPFPLQLKGDQKIEFSYRSEESALIRLYLSSPFYQDIWLSEGTGLLSYSFILKDGIELNKVELLEGSFKLERMELTSVSSLVLPERKGESSSGSWTIQNRDSLQAGRIRLVEETEDPWIEIKLSDENHQVSLLWNSAFPSFYWDSRWLGFTPQTIQYTGSGLFTAEEISLTEDTLPLCDMGIIESRAVPMENSYLLYRWSVEPDILIFDFRDYSVQAAFLKRLAFFIEKPGYRGTLLDNDQLEGKHGWNAHDYSAESLSLFFNKATEENFELNPEEEDLKILLLQEKILLWDVQNKRYTPGGGAIISFTRESSDALRHNFLVHEGVHGLFFTNQNFRDGSFQIWNRLSKDEQEIWKFFLYNNEHPYDSDWEYLAVTELVAYILQNKRSDQESYFRYRFSRQVRQQGERAAHLLDFLDQNPAFFSGLCTELEALLQNDYPLTAGDFALVRTRALQDK